MDHKVKSNSFNMFDEKDCGYPGLSWPQRNFMCNFCKKEYKSAQALGGHMNVHRRDRARLRLSSPSLDHHPNPNPNPSYASPPSPVRYFPYRPYHSSLFPLSFTTNEEDEQQKLSLLLHPARDFLGHVTTGGGDQEEDEIRVWKKREIFNAEMEMGLLKDAKVELDLDLELRLGPS